MVNKENINVAYVKSAKVWLWSIGKSRTGQVKSFSEIERLSKKEKRSINK